MRADQPLLRLPLLVLDNELIDLVADSFLAGEEFLIGQRLQPDHLLVVDFLPLHLDGHVPVRLNSTLQVFVQDQLRILLVNGARVHVLAYF